MTKKNIFIILFVSLSLFSFLLFILIKKRMDEKIISGVLETKKERIFDKYSFENLKQIDFKGSEIKFYKLIKEEENYFSYAFFFADDFGGRISGLANLPKKTNSPVIVMFRGYINREVYQMGMGSKNTAEFFAQNGFLTLAPDFLGYGDSDTASNDPLEERFKTYTTALSLLSSIKNLNRALSEINSDISSNTQSVGIWGHSNGGHIALSVLAISGKKYPTVLWAPVSKPFPYSILYYTDEFDDHGKYLRKIVSDFEKEYDVEKFSPPNYYPWIQSPIELHQGGRDDAVPQRWSDLLYEDLKSLGEDVDYYTYPSEDHNFANGSWTAVVSRSFSFFQKQLY
ncbi:MAG: Peptidase [Candidatus Levybacteria bacterium GW2011_GWA2_40_8]|nr:MAG: Peptidase [Candidatus Levybacteria bacterium GW2011_GWA2_40_8]